MTATTPTGDPRRLLDDIWAGFDPSTSIVGVDELSALVSTNRVFRLLIDDGRRIIAKVSSYGSYFLFREDHDRIHRCVEALRTTRWDGVLADVLARDGRVYTWYDGSTWAVLYHEVEHVQRLPRILDDGQITRLAGEIAEFHLACTKIAPSLPPASKSIKSDAIHLLDLLESPFAPRNFELPAEQIGVLWRHTHRFLLRLDELGYDDWPRIPVLVDWNLGNFSVRDVAGALQVHSRWDYDWFRIEPRMLDFYFLSRVSSRTGDRTAFTYASHTLTEPRFLAFLAAYQRVYPLSAEELAFIPEVYRFFILNYVVREGSRFFLPEFCTRFRREAATRYLPGLDQLDPSPLVALAGAGGRNVAP